jgi:hypothetical protein
MHRQPGKKKKLKRLFLFDIDDATVETGASGERSNAKRFSAARVSRVLPDPDHSVVDSWSDQITCVEQCHFFCTTP